MAAPPAEGTENAVLAASLQSLLARAQALLDEITEFESFLRDQQSEIDIWSFKRDLKGERDSLERSGRLLCAETTVECVANRIDSSNVSWYEALWAVAKRQCGVTALRRKMFRSSLHGDGLKQRPRGAATSTSSTSSRKDQAAVGKQNVLVDIIANDGLEWIKLSTITPRRLLFELAKEGWNGPDSSSESDADEPSNEESPRSSIGVAELKLVKLATEMKHAACGVRIRYRHPQIRFILTHIAEGESDEVDAVVAAIRATGATVDCEGAGDDGDDGDDDDSADEAIDMDHGSLKHCIGSHRPVSIHTTAAFRHDMLPTASTSTTARRLRLTAALNIDCTILLSLISDISHVLREDLHIAPPSRYCADVRRQIEVDAQTPLLPNDLYPVLAGRDLVCTTEAARRMREIVETMGTPAEKLRAEVLFGDGTMADRSPDELRAHLAGYTAHAVPESLRLPIRVVDFDVDAVLAGSAPAKHLPVAFANDVVTTKLRLSVVNKSMFLYGWDAGVVTLTGNRSATSQIQRAINEALDAAEARDDAERRSARLAGRDTTISQEAMGAQRGMSHSGDRATTSLRDGQVLGPEFWFSTPRSLIGKDKGKESGIDHLDASRRAWEKWVAE